MELGDLKRQIRIDAPPAVVYDVISSPEHIAAWWADEAEIAPVAGGTGTLRFHDRRVQVTVVEAVREERFSFRWNYPDGATPSVGNSMLVTFRLVPDGEGTLLHVTEQGMREQGWEAAVLEEYLGAHGRGWDACMSALATYAADLSAAR
jgi:uncharacterized protein YndB with AHSA1/START domain